ncbi:MAG: M48 family metallopeptidase [Paludibacteraceae bacterium]|nr:M48 family metallopeptidase [Paludibacteraceae bacterium]
MLKPKIELQEKLSRQIYDALQGNVVEEIIKEAMPSDSGDYWRNAMEGHSFKVEKRLLPKLYDTFDEIKKALKYNEAVDLYITGDSTVNAFSVASEREGDPHIINLNSALVELMTDDELKFVIGHELGHLINEDTKLHRLINFVFPEVMGMPTAMFHKVRLEGQLAELVADRYGYMAVGKLEPCVSAFFKMASGLDLAKMHIEVEALLEENIKHLEYFMNDKGVSRETHPVNPIRVQALNLFDKEKTNKSLAKAMEPMIQILLKVGSSSVDYYISRFVATSGLIVAMQDEEMSKEELDMILDNLAETQIFPMEFLKEMNETDKVPEIFAESIGKIFEEEPHLREGMFRYLIGLVIADKRLDKREIELLYQLGDNYFAYSKKEVAIMMAEMVQAKFVPNIYNNQ